MLIYKTVLYLHPNLRAISSVGSEHPDIHRERSGVQILSEENIDQVITWEFHLDKELKNNRAISSVGSEHLVYTEGVRGSNPLLPTKFHLDKELKNIGQLAQLVQSTSFTPRGSGVRIPYCPLIIKSFTKV